MPMFLRLPVGLDVRPARSRSRGRSPRPGRTPGSRGRPGSRTRRSRPAARTRGRGRRRPGRSGCRCRRVDAVARARRGVGDAVGVDEEVADALLRQHLVEAREVAALRQPDARRAPPEVAPVVGRGHRDLGPHRLRVLLHERQEAVGGAAGDELELPGVLQPPEGAHQVAVVAVVEEAAQLPELVPVVLGEPVEGRVVAGAVHLLVGQLAEPVELAGVAARRAGRRAAWRRAAATWSSRCGTGSPRR